MKIRSALMAAALAFNSGSVPEMVTAYSMRVNCEHNPDINDIVGLEELSSVLGDPEPYEEHFRIELADRDTKRSVSVSISHLGAVSLNGRLLTDSDAGLPLLRVGENAALIGGIPSTYSPLIYESSSTAATLMCANTIQN